MEEGEPLSIQSLLQWSRTSYLRVSTIGYDVFFFSLFMYLMSPEEMNGENDSKKPVGPSGPKCCADCNITKTPLWRVGPSDPKLLCNACGIRYRKKRVSPSASIGPPELAATPET
ncbi:hypothetical protein SAY87_004601 [Trapa incisa]|uniref:GATA-type domain-containing protein n=1 Tax=Trapa incisa TaxID=236973 RepID=A0AAN7JP64_9MYRT|nr:hypothetical protein SAY87_004601 [Trapa incisa]